MSRLTLALACVLLPAAWGFTAEAAKGAASPAAAGVAADYRPEFTATKTERGNYWILDHGQRVAIFNSHNGTERYQIGLFRQFPGQSIDEKSVVERDIMDYVFMPGLRLSTHWIGAKAMKGVPGEMKVDSSDPSQIVINLSWHKSAEEFGTQVLRVTYDKELAKYVVRVEDDLQLSKPGGGEYCNFYANGLGDLRPDVTRYDRLIYQDGDAGEMRAHYLSVRLPQPSVIHLPAQNGLVGYVNEKDGNPVVLIEESSPRTHDDICLSWFDSHLIWDDAGAPGQKDIPVPQLAGPPYRYHVKFKAYWLNAGETESLLAKTKTVSLEPFAEKFQGALPIQMNVVNDFENLADYKAGLVKRMYFVLSSRGISWDKTVAHSGQHSICMTCSNTKGLSLSPGGPELNVTPGKQVKVSVWVKTKDVSSEGFYLESGFWRYTPQGPEQYGEPCRSVKLTGTHDWTLLQLPMPLTPAKAQFLGAKGSQRIALHLAGPGTVWVDDFVFAEADAGSASPAAVK